MGDNITDFSSRVLCSDGTCIGVIGSDGKCKECGKPYEHIDNTVPGNENIIKTKNTISHVSVDEKRVKCKTCGFIAFGDDQYTAEHKKCLGCGNIMGQEPIKTQPSSPSDILLETCQNCKHQFSKRASKCPKCQQERTSLCFVCKKHIPQSSKYCPECGDPAPFEQQSSEKNNSIGIIKSEESTSNTSDYLPELEKDPINTNQKNISDKSTNYPNNGASNIEFHGTTFEWFWRGLLATVLSCFVIPAPWMFTWFCNWFVQNIKKTGNTTLSFSGRGSQIWFPVITLIVLTQAGRFSPTLPFDPAFNMLVYLMLYLSISCYFSLVIVKWFTQNIVSSTGTKIFFTGEYLPYLGWNILSWISFISIIGWAWVTAGMAKWFCRNIKSSNNHKVEFHGNGWNILWRSVIYIFSCILIIPIPWTSLWLVKWYISNLSVEKN